MRSITTLRTGDWLTRERVMLTAAGVLFLTGACTCWLLAGTRGTVDAWGRPVGTDFSDVYAAGWLADRGRAAAAWNWTQHYQAQQFIHHDRAVPFYGWHYPPPFLLAAALLARAPYLLALAIWQGGTLVSALVVVRKLVPGRAALLVALGAPATFVCLGHGQNGFLTAALLGGGLLLLDRRPVMAGLLLGCLVYKPQLGLVLPVLLVTMRNGRALAGATTSAALLCLLTLAAWGSDPWVAFTRSAPLTRQVLLMQCTDNPWKLASPFAAMRLWGAPVMFAWIVQAAAALLALASVLIAARATPRIRAMLVVSACLLATPYVWDYDMVALGIAIAFLAAQAQETGWRDWEKSLLALAYLAPLCGGQVAEVSGVPLNLIAIMGVWGIGMLRALADPAFRPFALSLSKGRSALSRT